MIAYASVSHSLTTNCISNRQLSIKFYCTPIGVAEAEGHAYKLSEHKIFKKRYSQLKIVLYWSEIKMTTIFILKLLQGFIQLSSLSMKYGPEVCWFKPQLGRMGWLWKAFRIRTQLTSGVRRSTVYDSRTFSSGKIFWLLHTLKFTSATITMVAGQAYACLEAPSPLSKV